MQIAKGYKQTEVGVMPEDWTTTPAINICQSVIDCKNRTAPVVNDDEYAVVRTPNVRDGRFIRKELRFTDAESFKVWTSRAVPQDGDILITREAPMGEVCLKPINTKVCLGQRMMLYRPNPDKSNSHYLLHALMSQPVQSNLAKKVGGSTVGHAKVDDIRNVILPLPPTLAEQEAIAEALSDADSLIESLQQLIAKKRQIKQGAMQELLHPKPDWDVCHLCDIADVRDGTHDSPKYVKSGVPFVTSKNLIKNRIDFTEINFISGEDAVEVDKRSKVDYGDILISMIGTVGSIGLVDFEPNFSIKNVGLVKPTSCEHDSLYLVQYLQSSVFESNLDDILNGGIQKFISLGVLRSLKIPFPPTLEEQTRIATILSDMDEEITTLETKLTKAQQIKQGMMSELLTGKTRLI